MSPRRRERKHEKRPRIPSKRGVEEESERYESVERDRMADEGGFDRTPPPEPERSSRASAGSTRPARS